MKTGQQYKESLRSQSLNLYYRGEKIGDITEHPAIKPHINAAAMTYDIAFDPVWKDIATAKSNLVLGDDINYFTHLFHGAEDFLNEAKLLRELSQRTGTCFQRCTGHDALNALYSVTYEVDKAKGTEYHRNLQNFLKRVQVEDLMCSSAITDAKGDRSLPPGKQPDLDAYVHIVKREKDGIIVRGAKVNQTGVVNSHEVIVMPTQPMGPDDKDFALSFAIPTATPGITYILGRQAAEEGAGGDIDQGNAEFGVVGGEAMIIFDDVFVPWERVFLCGEFEFAGMIVERFASLHRQRYGACKAGTSDVLIGASAALAEYHGVEKNSIIRDKLAEMVHLTETSYGCALASALSAFPSPAGTYLVSPLRAAVTKQNVSRFTYDIFRIAHDLAGGFIATMPSEPDFKSVAVGELVDKYYHAAADVPTENRLRLGRLIENMTGVAAAVEATHGAGSPQAQRMMILREADLEYKKRLACRLAGIRPGIPRK